ncbi:MAG: TldD/PmbA family protein [Ignavibacteria bacterium]|jgi:PmbA protein|nr:TldD/PmbA family protein [Ignavibacteria bacterium]
MNNKERLDLAEWAMNYALKTGADESSAVIYNSRDIEIEYRDKKLETMKESTRNSLSLQVYADKRYSGHSTNDLRKDSLEKFIKEAVAGTKYLTRDEFRALPDPKYYPEKTDTDLGLTDPGYDKIEASERKNIASEIERVASAQSDLIISATAGYNDSYYEFARVHSNGFKGEGAGTFFTAGASVTVNDKDGGRPEDWYYATSRFRNELPTPEMLGRNAAERALKKIGQKKIESGIYEMLVENRAGSRLLYMLAEPLSARALQQKSSFLDGMLDKPIASDKLTVIDDPFVRGGFGSRIFDGEGIAAKKKMIIEKGVLRNYYVDNYYGKKIGMEPNSGSTSNILFEYGTKSLEDMIKDQKRAILVNGFIGGNSNSTTGDFSFGIVGFLIENGKIVKPVNEMNVSGNAKDFWKSLAEMGNDPYPYSSMKIPTMAFTGVNFSGL